MSDKLFGESKSSQTHDETDNDDVDYVAHYFGDKEPSIDDYKEILKGKYHADKHIATLEIENRGLRKMEETSAKFDDLLQRLKSPASTGSNEGSNQKPQALDETDNSSKKDDEQGKFTPDMIQKLISQELNKQSELTQKQRNLEAVKTKAAELYGRNYETELLKKAKEINASPAFLESIAASNPDAFFRMMGMNDVQSKPSNPNGAPPRPSVDTVRGNMAGQGNVKNYAFYSNLRKTNPKLYSSKATQAEMHKMAATLGEDFYK